ncbi:Holliday junction resolvase RuvX [Candidatus Saccharibacteria bacterium]|nr:Holliday junction resolvase RuvX [Candidatus Saccharibacteria bacterium]
MAIFGLDVGERRIGVASVDPGTKIVKAERAFMREELPELVKMISDAASTSDEMGDTMVVVGMPTSQSGEFTAQSERVKEFTLELKELVPETVRINFYGESATTMLAIDRLKERGLDAVALRQARADGTIDVEAACIILEGWAEERL